MNSSPLWCSDKYGKGFPFASFELVLRWLNWHQWIHMNEYTSLLFRFLYLSYNSHSLTSVLPYAACGALFNVSSGGAGSIFADSLQGCPDALTSHLSFKLSRHLQKDKFTLHIQTNKEIWWLINFVCYQHMHEYGLPCVCIYINMHIYIYICIDACTNLCIHTCSNIDI